MTERTGAVRRRVEEALVVLGAVAVVWALLQPRLAAGARADELTRVRTVVDTLRGAVRTWGREGGGSDVDGPVGVPEDPVPGELAPYLPDDLALATAAWRLSVRTWPVARPARGGADGAVAPDTAGGPLPAVHHRWGVTLASADTALLADLLDAYGRDASFVKDTTWTLVFPDPSAP